MQKRFLHHRSSAIHTLTDNLLGTAFIKLIRVKKEEKKKKTFINNYNNYNYDCNKQKPRTINVGVQYLVSQYGMNEPASGKKIYIQTTTPATMAPNVVIETDPGTNYEMADLRDSFYTMAVAE